VRGPDAIAAFNPQPAAATQPPVKFDTRLSTSGVAPCRLVAGDAALSTARNSASSGVLLRWMDIDLTSRMGSDLPCMSNVVDATPRLRADADDAGARRGAWHRSGVRCGGNEAVGRAGSPRLGSPPDQIPLPLEV
jgi:hypothetical protein